MTKRAYDFESSGPDHLRCDGGNIALTDGWTWTFCFRAESLTDNMSFGSQAGTNNYLIAMLTGGNTWRIRSGGVSGDNQADISVLNGAFPTGEWVRVVISASGGRIDVWREVDGALVSDGFDDSFATDGMSIGYIGALTGGTAWGADGMLMDIRGYNVDLSSSQRDEVLAFGETTGATPVIWLKCANNHQHKSVDDGSGGNVWTKYTGTSTMVSAGDPDAFHSTASHIPHDFYNADDYTQAWGAVDLVKNRLERGGWSIWGDSREGMLERAVAAQNWHSTARSWMRVHTPQNWVGALFPLQRDALSTLESPQIWDQDGSAVNAYPVATSSGWNITYSDATDGDEGIHPTPGAEIVAPNATNTTWLDYTFDHDQLTWTQNDVVARLLYHKYTNGAVVELQSGRGSITDYENVDTGGTAAIDSEDTDTISAGDADVLFRVASRIAHGNQTSPTQLYIRACGVCLYRPSTEGFFLAPMGLGSTNLTNWNTAHPTGTGAFTDAALFDYLDALPVTINTILIGLVQNDVTDSKANKKTGLDAVVDRAAAYFANAGITDGLIIVRDTVPTQHTATNEQYQESYEACLEVCQEWTPTGGTKIAFVSVMHSNTYQGGHLTVAECDNSAGNVVHYADQDAADDVVQAFLTTVENTATSSNSRTSIGINIGVGG